MHVIESWKYSNNIELRVIKENTDVRGYLHVSARVCSLFIFENLTVSFLKEIYFTRGI